MHVRQVLHRLLTARIATPGIVSLMVLVVAMNEWTHQRIHTVRTERLVVLQARLSSMELMQLLTAAEAAQRGYLLTGQDHYLKPYEDAVAALPQRLTVTLAFLKVLGEQAASERMEARKLIELKLSELATTIALQRSGQTAQALELLKSGIGEDGMSALREALGGALRAASIQDGTMEIAVRHELALRRWTVNLLALVSGLAALAYVRKLANDARAGADARARLESEVQARTADLRELASNLQTVQEAERARLSRELHDEIGGLLTAAKFDLMRLRNVRDPEQVSERLQQASRRLDEVVAIKRRIIEGLRPSSLQHLGLRKALELLCAEVSERLGVPVLARLDEVELKDEAELTVYRLVQEALTNAQKYARADAVGVVLTASDKQMVVSIEDNGAGFDVQASRVARHGLAGMRHRVESYGGRLQLESAPGKGTRVTATLPLHSVARVPADGLAG